MNIEKRNIQGEKNQGRWEDFADPIGFIYADHERLRQCCEQLVQLADKLDADDASEVARLILDYMEQERPLHIADEEEDLFRLLKRRSGSEDSVLGVIELLAHEHREDVEIGRSLLESLRSIAAGMQPGGTGKINCDRRGQNCWQPMAAQIPLDQ